MTSRLKMEGTEKQTANDDQTVWKSPTLDKYIPLAGCLSYELFSAYIMRPQLFSELFGNGDAAAANILWLNAHVGIGWYLFRTRHLSELSTPWKITHCVFGTTMFNFGSVLLWSSSKWVMPEMSTGLKLVLGLGSGAVFLCLGKQYLDQVDELVRRSWLSE